MRCDMSLYYKFIIQLAGENFFLNWWISGKFTDKMVDCFMRSFALHFSPQRCGTRNISVWRTETVTNNIVVMLTGRFNSLYGHQISNFCRPVLTCYQTDTIIDWPTVDHAQHFAATSFSLLKLLCTVCHAIFNMADMNTFLLGNELLLVSSDKYFKTYWVAKSYKVFRCTYSSSMAIFWT